MAISIRGVAAPIEITSIHRICSSIAANQVVINRPAIAAVDATFWRALRLVEGASSVASLIDSFFCFSIRGFLNSCHLAVAFLEKFNYGLRAVPGYLCGVARFIENIITRPPLNQLIGE